MVLPGAGVRVHTAEPDKARLIITWHGTEPGGDDGGSGAKIGQLPEAERTINATFYGDTVLNDVVFDWVGKGDIRLLEPDVREKRQRVTLGDHLTSPAEEVFVAIPGTDEMSNKLAMWQAERESRGGDRSPPYRHGRTWRRVPPHSSLGRGLRGRRGGHCPTACARRP